MVQRMGMVITVKPEKLEEYKRLHANPWPELNAALSAANIRNYSIFLREPENIMFAYFEYHGTDYEADMARMAADPKTQEWWAVCGPLQRPLDTRAKGEWWAGMEEVFHVD